MKIITLEQLEEISCKEDVKEVTFNGVSGQDGVRNWYTVYYNDNSEEDVYTKE